MGLVCAVLAGCGSPDSIENSIDYLAVQERDGSDWSIIDSKGKLVKGQEFSNEPTAAVEGIFSVYENGGYSIYSVKDSKKAVVEDLASVGIYFDGVIPATKKDARITLLDKKGKVKATLNPIGGKEIVACRPYLQEGLLAVMDEEYNWGFVNKSGEVKIKPKYSGVLPFIDGLAIASKDYDSHCVIDKKGKEIFKIKEDYDVLDNFVDGLIPVKDKETGNYGYLDKKGKFTKINGDIDGFELLSDEFYAFRQDYQWGVKNMKGETVIKANYESIHMLSNGNFLVEKEGSNHNEWTVINKKGDKKVEFEDYRSVRVLDCENFAFIGRGRSKYELLDGKGKPLSEDNYANINYNPSQGEYVRSDYSAE